MSGWNAEMPETGELELDKITALEDSVEVLCHHGVIHMEFSWETDKMLEVIG